MNKILAILTLASTIVLSACGNNETANTNSANADEKVIKIATEGAYPPFNNMDTSGKLVGFDIDVMNAICAKINAKCEIASQEWEGIIPSLLTGKYDAIIAGMSITPERLEKVDFSIPYFSNTVVWLAKTDGSFNPTEIKNKVLGGQRATTGADYIYKLYNKKSGNTVQLYDSYINAYLDLKAGRNDAVMAEKASALEWLKTGGQEGFGIVGEEIDINDQLAIAVRKGDPLKTEFDQALADIKASGELAKIEAKYFK